MIREITMIKMMTMITMTTRKTMMTMMTMLMSTDRDFAGVLEQAERFETPFACTHQPGAVVWLRLKLCERSSFERQQLTDTAEIGAHQCEW